MVRRGGGKVLVIGSASALRGMKGASTYRHAFGSPMSLLGIGLQFAVCVMLYAVLTQGVQSESIIGAVLGAGLVACTSWPSS